MDISFPSSSSNFQAIATPTVSPELRAALSTFHSYYPNATLTAELVTTHQEQYVVRAVANIHSHAIVSSMATAEHVEIAEDRAKLRAITSLLAQQHSDVNLAISPPIGNLYTEPSPISSTQLSKLPSDNLSHPSTTSPQPQSFETNTSVQDDTILYPEHPSPEPFTPISQELDEGDRLTSSSLPPLSMADDSDKPIELVQEEEMPVSNLADIHSPEVETSAAAAHQIPPSKTETATASSPPKSKKRASTSKTSKSASPSASATAKNASAPEKSLQTDLSDIIAKTSVELKRLGWTNSQGREHLQKVYGKRSRQQLTDPELIDFLNYLESQPSPSPSAHI